MEWRPVRSVPGYLVHNDAMLHMVISGWMLKLYGITVLELIPNYTLTVSPTLQFWYFLPNLKQPP